MTEVVPLGVGRALAEARQAQGLEVVDVAQQLKFMPRQIDSLEAERFDALPGPTIARGMVRNYARLLKIDPEPLLRLMDGHVEAPDATPQLAARYSQPVPFSDGGRRSTALYLGLSAVVLAAAGAAVYEWRHEQAVPEFVAASDVSAEQTAAPAQTASLSAPPSPAPSLQEIAEPLPVKAAAKPSASAVEKPAEPIAEKATVAPAVAPAVEAKAATGQNRLVLRFEEEAWVEVTDAQGRKLVSSLNPAGTERVVRARLPLDLVIGNAQHVRVLYNDREVDLQPHVKVEVARFTLK